MNSRRPSLRIARRLRCNCDMGLSSTRQYLPAAFRRRQQAYIATGRQHIAHQKQSGAAVVHRRIRVGLHRWLDWRIRTHPSRITPRRIRLGVRAVMLKIQSGA
jgi:hypothetical protein